MSSLTHASRANVFQREAKWCLTADALERRGGELADAPSLRFYLRLLWPWSGIGINRGGSCALPLSGDGLAARESTG